MELNVTNNPMKVTKCMWEMMHGNTIENKSKQKLESKEWSFILYYIFSIVFFAGHTIKGGSILRQSEAHEDGPKQHERMRERASGLGQHNNLFKVCPKGWHSSQCFATLFSLSHYLLYFTYIHTHALLYLFPLSVENGDIKCICGWRP